VVDYGGSIAGEYGEGQRGELLARMLGPELVQAFREFKAHRQWPIGPSRPSHWAFRQIQVGD
jgi:hypothetical protein